TQRRLESRLSNELVAESKQLETWSGVVEEEGAGAQSIGEALGVPGNEARGIWRSAERRTQGGGGRCHATVTTALCDCRTRIARHCLRSIVGPSTTNRLGAPGGFFFYGGE